MRALFSFLIGSGSNVPLGALNNIESIIPSGGTRFYPPKMYGSYNPGIYRIRGNGTIYIAGFPSLIWTFDKLTYVQHRYLMTTFCSSGYSGLVTIYTKTDNTTTYSRLNAVMVLPKHSESTPNFTIFEHYQVRFTRLEAAS